MRYFKNNEGVVFAFENDQMTVSELSKKIDDFAGSDDDLNALKNTEIWISDDLMEMSNSEIDYYLNAGSKTRRIREIESRLAELDLLSLRPLRAIEAGSATQYDHDKLIELDAESETLRAELRGLMS